MNKEANISKESTRFIENLRLYLFSTGKKMHEIDEIVEELQAHLEEAEANGKSVSHIIGQSPKDFMASVADEMKVDYAEWLKYILIIVIGSFAFIIAKDLLAGALAYSVLEIVGTVVILGLYILNIFAVFRYVASHEMSGKKETLLLAIPAGLPMVLFLGLYALDGWIETPIILFSPWASIIIGAFVLAFLIGISIWAKMWTPIVVVVLLTVPDYLLAKTSLSVDVQLILGMVIAFGGILIYFWLAFGLFGKKDK